MKKVWLWIQTGYLRVIEPVADWLVRRKVHPNTITTIGTVCTIIGGVLYGTGHIQIAGWWLGLTALFDVLDGTVARRTGRSSTFGAFYDSTLDRVADGAVMGGLAVFYATSPRYYSTTMVVVCIAGLIGTFLTSYTRARAEALGVDAKVGILQRPERVTLLSAPQAFFGLVFNGWVLIAIVVLLSVTAWITAVQRILFVHRMTTRADVAPRELADRAAPLPRAAVAAAPAEGDQRESRERPSRDFGARPSPSSAPIQ